MGKIGDYFGRKTGFSIKWSFFIYITICIAVSLAGAAGIGYATNYAQDCYRAKYSLAETSSGKVLIKIFADDYGKVYTQYSKAPLFDSKHEKIYFVISNIQIILIPLWVIFCFGLAGVIFYGRELKEPINTLMDATKKISENQLDFEVYCCKKNELGLLCSAFSEMRRALYENNREMWRSLEERKRLNAAFSHDLRTPLTVLRGYAEFLEKYSPNGKISNEKLIEVLVKIKGQIFRLENYTRKMNAVQRLDDIIPNRQSVSAERLEEQLSETGRLICGEKEFSLAVSAGSQTEFNVDAELVIQTFENIVSNAARYAKDRVAAQLLVSGGTLKLSVCDNGVGFSAETLKYAVEPFFRGDGEQSKSHFGLGLYICRIICEKCGGRLIISNDEIGARVTAEFPVVYSNP